MSELKELIEKYMELEDNFDEDNEEQAEELHDLGHEIDHAVYNEEFTIVYNADTEDEEFLGLAVDAPQCDFVIFAESVHDCSE